MSASSSITRTEMFPLRMQRSTVPGTGGVFVVSGPDVPGRTAALARREATIGSPSDQTDRWWLRSIRPTCAALSLPGVPAQECRRPQTRASCPGRPPPGDQDREVVPLCRCSAHRGGAMVQRRRFRVAGGLPRRKFSSAWFGTTSVVVTPDGAPSGTLERPAARNGEMQAIGCPFACLPGRRITHDPISRPLAAARGC